MRNSHVVVGLVFAASLGFALGSCGSSGSSSSSNGLVCPGSTGSCTQAQLDTYDNCVAGKCGSQISTCYGSGYQSGSFSGPCGTYGSCASKCGCTDTACRTACGQPSSDCVTCLFTVATCALSSTCMQPACLAGGGGGTSGGAGGHVGSLGGSSGGLGGFSGSLGGFTGTGSGTCADLLACCNATQAALKSACMSAYSQVVSSGDTACGIVLSGIKSTYCP